MEDPDTISDFKLNKNMVNFINGSISGGVAKTIIAPLDRGKIAVQISEEKFTYKGLYKYLRNSVLDNGVLSLWRGHTTTLIRILPYSGIQFSTFEYSKAYFIKKSHSNQLSDCEKIVSGCCAGINSVLLTYPLDMLRARMAITTKLKYANMFQAYKVIIKEEGIKTLYRGITPSLLGILPYSGFSFFTYETLKNYMMNNNDQNYSFVLKIVCGGIAGLVGQTASYPIDIIRRIMQTDGIIKYHKKFNNSFEVVRFVFTNRGILGGFYKGLSINWIKGPIASASSFTTYEILKTTTT